MRTLVLTKCSHVQGLDRTQTMSGPGLFVSCRCSRSTRAGVLLTVAAVFINYALRVHVLPSKVSEMRGALQQSVASNDEASHVNQLRVRSGPLNLVACFEVIKGLAELALADETT